MIYTKAKIIKRLLKLGIDTSVVDQYYEPHRYYHNIDHIIHMLNEADRLKILTDKLFLAIVFHDAIYDPLKHDNEERSVDLLFNQYPPDEEIRDAIMATKNHVKTIENPKMNLSYELCYLDLDILYQSTVQEFMEFESKIFKEYQFVDYKIYKEKRIELLIKLSANPIYIEYVKNKKTVNCSLSGFI
jgi:predicted metal-dependent HD superfamily phosphohydrolase